MQFMRPYNSYLDHANLNSASTTLIHKDCAFLDNHLLMSKPQLSLELYKNVWREQY